MKSSLKRSSKNLTIILGVISFIFLASLYSLWKTLDNLSNQQKEKETYLSSFKEKREAFSDLEKRYKEAFQIYDKLYQALPDKKEESTLVSSLYVLENKNGVKITSIKVGESSSKKKKESKEKSSPLSQTEKEEDLYTLPIKIEVEGSYQNFYYFIKDLQNNTRYISINKIKITGTSKEISDKITATLETNAYLKP